MRAQPVVDTAHGAVDEIQESDERDEHGGDIEGQMKAVDSTARNGAEEIGFFFHFGHFDAARGERLFGFRHEHFCHKQRTWGSHDNRGEKMLGFDAEGDVGGHDAAGDMGHAASHDDHQLGFCELVQKGTDSERGFGLAHENTCGDVERFRAAGAHDASHDPSGDPNDKLHDPYVIEEREKSGDENNRRQHLKCKNKMLGGSGKTGSRSGRQAELAKDKLGAVKSVAEEQIDVVAGLFKKVAADGETQNKDGE